MRRSLLVVVPLALLVVETASAQTGDLDLETRKKPPAPTAHWGTEFADPHHLTRFGLVTRGLFGNRNAFSFELGTQIRVASIASIGAVLPIVTGSDGLGGGLGNIGLSTTLGGAVVEGDTLVHVFGGLDVYLPTAVDEGINTTGLAPAMRAYQPMMYLADVFSFRVRGGADLRAGPLLAALEVGVAPGFQTSAGGDALFLVNVGGRVAFEAGKVIEPYLEAKSTIQLVGEADVAPPFLLTPGVRFHVADLFDPAIFASFNFVDSSAVIIGLDLTFAFRPSNSKSRKTQSTIEDDFLD